MAKGDPVATYKVADMYKNGYYVGKNIDKYEEIIEKLYPKVKLMLDVFAPVPEVCMRLARIRQNQGEIDEAINLYLHARNYLAQRISYNAFFGNLNMMKWLIDDLYELIEFDKDCMDFFDLYYLLKVPNNITFICDGKVQELESVMEGNECVIRFNDKWYRSRDDFFKEATVNGKRLTTIYSKLYGFEVK